VHHYGGIPDGFRDHGFLPVLSSAERQGAWRNKGRNRRHHHPCRDVCRLAKGLGGVPAGQGGLE